MGAWYWIGVAAGLGVGAGIVIGALLPRGAGAIAVAAALASRPGSGSACSSAAGTRRSQGGIGGVPRRRSSFRSSPARCAAAGPASASLIVALARPARRARVRSVVGYLEAGSGRPSPALRRRGDRRYAGLRSSPKTERCTKARPDRDRRPDAGRLRGRSRRRRAGARPARRATAATAARSRPSLADAGLLVLDRDGRPPGRAPDPAPRLVPPRRAAGRRVRLLVRSGARGRDRRSSSTRSST